MACIKCSKSHCQLMSMRLKILFRLFYLICLNVLPACMYAHHKWAWCPWRLAEGVGCPGNRKWGWLWAWYDMKEGKSIPAIVWLCRNSGLECVFDQANRTWSKILKGRPWKAVVLDWTAAGLCGSDLTRMLSFMLGATPSNWTLKRTDFQKEKKRQIWRKKH